MHATAAHFAASPAARPAPPPQAYDRLKAIADNHAEVVGNWSCSRHDVIRLSTLAADLVGLSDSAPQLCLGMGPHLPLGSPSLRHAFFAAIVGVQMGRALGIEATQRLAVAKGAMVMNLASLELQDDLARPQASPSPAQRITLARHPTLTADLLIDSPGADLRWIEAVEQHHEALDGSGYPNALHGNQICLEARILKLADMWCALVAPRRHREPKTPREAMHWLLSRSRQCVDPLLLDALRRLNGHYPPGTLVRLANRETAIVIDSPRGTAPPRQVISFLGGQRLLLRDPARRDTGRSMFAIRGYAALPPIEIKPAYWNRVWAMSGAAR